MAQYPCLASGVGRAVGVVIGGDLGVSRRCLGNRLRADLGDLQDALLGDQIALAVLGVEGLKVAGARIQPGAKGIGSDQRNLAFALLQQHRRVGAGHAHRDPGVGRGRGDQQPLGLW